MCQEYVNTVKKILCKHPIIHCSAEAPCLTIVGRLMIVATEIHPTMDGPKLVPKPLYHKSLENVRMYFATCYHFS